MNRKVGVILSYVLIVLEAFSTLLITPFVIRTIGQAEYGVYKLAAAVNAYLLLLDLGLGNAITRFIAKYRANKNVEDERKFLGIVTVYYAVIAVIAIIVGIILVSIFPTVFAKGLNQEEMRLGQKLLSITMINSAITLGTSAYANILIGYERFAVSKGASIVQIILRMILILITVSRGMGSTGIVTVNLFLTIICRTFFVMYVLFALKAKPAFKGIQKAQIKEIIAYSSLILLQMIATQLNSTVDQILLGSIVKSSAVLIGIYGIGTQIVQYYQSLGSAFNGVMMPGVVRMIESNPSQIQITDEMSRVGRILLMMLMPIWGCFLVCGKEFIYLWAGVENLQAYYVTIILMSAYMIIMTESIGSQILWARNQHKEQAYLKFGIVVLNIILTISLIRWNPLIGATIGTLISLILGDVVVMNVIFKKKIGISISEYYKKLLHHLIPCIIPAIITGLISYQLSAQYNWMSFCVRVMIMLLLYLLVLWFYGMNKREKNMLFGIANRIVHK